MDALADCTNNGGHIQHLQVDRFLLEALQNPRHRLTVLRMELDIQMLVKNPEQQQLELPHFPTSYLRLAAHRVALHYGLQSMASDNTADGSGSRIIVRKTPESRYPSICLCEIPAKMSETDKPEHVKIAIKPRPQKAAPNDATDQGIKRSAVRSVEERKEEYDRARARIFNGSGSSDSEVVSAPAATDGRSSCSSGDENESGDLNVQDEVEKTCNRDGICRVAIFRDREKDRSDPDYDRSYDRYYRAFPSNQNFNLAAFNMQSFQSPFLQYETGFPQMGQLSTNQSSVTYRPSNPIIGPFGAVGLAPNSRGAVYLPCPSPTMMYAHSYDHLRQAMIQAPLYQQSLSFDHGQHQ
ncbi:hypothetical protein AMTRI_Chr01g127290 [Amborella trichopoda]